MTVTYLPSPIYLYRLRERLKKVYLNDIVFTEKEKGRRLENLAFLGLVRQEKKSCFFKDKLECDFVIEREIAIQVCWELDYQNEQRELKGLKQAMEYFKLKQGMILTYNQEKTVVTGRNKIEVVPLWKWLLQANR